MIVWLKKIIYEEFSAIFKNKAFALLLGLPIAYSILFGVVYSYNVIKYVPAVIYDQDQSAASRGLAQAFADSEKYSIVAQVQTQEEMEQYLQNGTANVAVAIPPSFSQNIKTGHSSEVLIMANGSNLMFTNSIISSSQEIIQSFSVSAGQKLFEALNQPPVQAIHSTLPVRLNVRIINNPTLSYSNFMLAGLGANGLQLAIILVTCTLLTKEYLKSGYQKCPPGTLIIGKFIPYWITAMLGFEAYIAIITLLFAVPFRGGFFSLLLIGCAFTFAVCAVGFFFSAIFRNEVLAIQAPILYIMPAFLFSGYSWPLFAMNRFSSFFSSLLPLSYAADCIRDILLAGHCPALYRNLLILFCFGAALLTLTTLIFAKQRTAISGRKVA